jgi:hypothetical protein
MYQHLFFVVFFVFIFSSSREKLERAGESRSRLSLLRRRAMMMMMMLFTREFLVNRVF